jgi:hypothetical protein
MWGFLLGTAAANKAASVGVGLSVMLAGAGTAEVTGIGPLVREAVHLTPAEDGATAPDDQAVVQSDDVVELDLEINEEESNDVDQQENGNGALVLATDEAPGNLVWHEHDGDFKLRGLLVGEGEVLLLRTAGPDGQPVDLVVDLATVEIHQPGRPAEGGEDGEDSEDGAIEDLDGRLVIASGTCGEPLPGDEDMNPVCTVESITILGNAGQNPPDEDGSGELESEDEDEDDDGGHGKPDHAGGPQQNLPTDE